MTDVVGDVLLHELRDTMTIERSKKAAIEARGLSIVTTGGALLTLLFGFAAFLGTSVQSAWSQTAITTVASGVAILAVACLIGIVCNMPGPYLEIDPLSLGVLAYTDIWRTEAAEAGEELSLAYVAIIVNWRRVNNAKSRLLLIALALEVAGVIAIGASAVVLAASW